MSEVPLHPHGGSRPFHQKSTCLTQLSLGPYLVQIWSRNTPKNRSQRNPRTPPSGLHAVSDVLWVCSGVLWVCSGVLWVCSDVLWMCVCGCAWDEGGRARGQTALGQHANTMRLSYTQLLMMCVGVHAIFDDVCGCAGDIIPWREAGLPNHHNDKVDSDQ